MSQTAYIWIGIVGLMVMTIVSRATLTLWPRRIDLPLRLQRALRFAPMAAITAVIVPSVLFHQGELALAMNNPKIWAAVASLIGWWATRHMAGCLAAGLSVYVIGKLLLLS
ncbi:MAG: hypothetical protein RJA58_1230 [Pseudomonadota bacterium]|jgi:branched-subunit amino acid transport protein